MKLLTKKSSNYQLLKWPMIHLLLTVTLVSLFLCHSSSSGSWLPSFHHSFNVYLSTCLISIFTHTLERRYMFLICNGILAFLAKTSLSCYNSSGGPDPAMLDQVSTEAEMKASSPSATERIDECVENLDEIATAEEEKKQDGKDAMEEGLEVQRDDISAEDEKMNFSLPEEEEEEEEEEEIVTPITVNEEIASPNTEELNRKIEEFIRKMKEEIRIDAQQQLVAV